MARGDACFEVIRRQFLALRCLRQVVQAAVDQAPIPKRSVLIGQQ